MKKILVVDDDKDILQVVQIALEMNGYEVLSSWNGNDTIKNMQQFSPDAVLLDVNLGDSNGITICSQIKSDDKLQNTPVLMFSAHAKGDSIMSQCQAEGFIGKPFDIFHLADVIKSKLPSD